MPNALSILKNSLNRPNATDIFTDREEPRATFWKHFKQITDDIAAGEYDDGNRFPQPIHYYGVGGQGKTTLLKKLIEEMKEKARSEESKPKKEQTPYRYLYYDFNELNTDSTSFIRSVKTTLEKNYDFHFPLTDFALLMLGYVEKEKAEKSKTVKETIEKSRTLSILFRATQLVPVVADIVEQAVLAVDLFESVSAVNLLSLFMRKEKNIDELKSWMENIKADSETNPEKIRENLHIYFSYDLENVNLKESPTPLTVFLDTFEKMYSAGEMLRYRESRKDRWLTDPNTGLIAISVKVFFVIASRDKLTSSSFNSDPENYRKDWETLGVEEHILNALSREDADCYLEKVNIRDKELREHICHVSQGVPIFLDLSREIYDNYMQSHSQQPPQKEQFAAIFGGKNEDIITRYLQGFSADMRKTVQAFSLLESWGDELGKKIRVDGNRMIEYYNQMKNFSFVSYDEENERYSFHQVVAEQIRQSIVDPGIEADVIACLKDYLEDKDDYRSFFDRIRVWEYEKTVSDDDVSKLKILLIRLNRGYEFSQTEALCKKILNSRNLPTTVRNIAGEAIYKTQDEKFSHNKTEDNLYKLLELAEKLTEEIGTDEIISFIEKELLSFIIIKQVIDEEYIKEIKETLRHIAQKTKNAAGLISELITSWRVFVYRKPAKYITEILTHLDFLSEEERFLVTLFTPLSDETPDLSAPLPPLPSVPPSKKYTESVWRYCQKIKTIKERHVTYTENDYYLFSIQKLLEKYYQKELKESIENEMEISQKYKEYISWEKEKNEIWTRNFETIITELENTDLPIKDRTRHFKKFFNIFILLSKFRRSFKIIDNRISDLNTCLHVQIQDKELREEVKKIMIESANRVRKATDFTLNERINSLEIILRCLKTISIEDAIALTKEMIAECQAAGKTEENFPPLENLYINLSILQERQQEIKNLENFIQDSQNEFDPFLVIKKINETDLNTAVSNETTITKIIEKLTDLIHSREKWICSIRIIHAYSSVLKTFKDSRNIKNYPAYAALLLDFCDRIEMVDNFTDFDIKYYIWRVAIPSIIINNVSDDFDSEKKEQVVRKIETLFKEYIPVLIRKNIRNCHYKFRRFLSLSTINEKTIREVVDTVRNEGIINEAFLAFLKETIRESNNSDFIREMWDIYTETHLRYLKNNGVTLYQDLFKFGFRNSKISKSLFREHIFEILETIRTDPNLDMLPEKDVNEMAEYFEKYQDQLRFREAVAALYKEKYGENDERTRMAYEALEMFRESETLMEENP